MCFCEVATQKLKYEQIFYLTTNINNRHKIHKNTQILCCNIIYSQNKIPVFCFFHANLSLFGFYGGP